MSSFVTCRPIVIIRKERQCILCLEKYPKKTEMMVQSGYWEGYWFKSYWCKCCQKFRDIVDADFSEGYMPGEFLDYEGFKEFKEQFKATV